jgi:hypothetical protein
LAAKKLAKLRHEHDDLASLISADFDRQQDLILQRTRATAEVRRLLQPEVGHHFVTDDYPPLVAARNEFNRVSSQLEHLNALQQDRSKRKNVLGQLINGIERYVASQKGRTTIAFFDLPEVEITEAPALAVERVRTKRREKLSELAEVEAAPPHPDLLRSKGRAQIEALAKRGRINFSRLIETGGPIIFPEQRHSFEAHGFVAQENAPRIHATVGANLPDVLAMVAFLQPELLLKKMEEAIAAGTSDEEALTEAERTTRIADIKADLLAIERNEEAFVELCGTEVLRRPDADVRAVFGINGPEPKGLYR